MKDLAAVMGKVDYAALGGYYEPVKVDYLDLRNTAFRSSVGLAIRITQHDGEPLQPREFASKGQALLLPEQTLREHLCPPDTAMPRFDDFVVMVTVYSVRYDRNFGIDCPPPD